ncbi:cbb3-type cytochrome c oxidase subunit 3 [Lysobacter ciconiae]|uniref:Cbb3-type cytochrome c oxidase subunit 3 n=1 Tax=Novilysobacter ciconiae TaxID=2781022 RepID=A0A7S6UF87_9GAMM|nr:cbb3-type cytochrome c oxidase subunit 3 [Lysobacter ciconiae]QOW19210.1 cbb3-type cytochrome c oxidase subunit 3 [Lysobacter ciconiae]
MLSGFITVFLMLVFIGVWIWAWRPENKASFEETARLALEDEPDDLGVAAHHARKQDA